MWRVPIREGGGRKERSNRDVGRTLRRPSTILTVKKQGKGRERRKARGGRKPGTHPTWVAEKPRGRREDCNLRGLQKIGRLGQGISVSSGGGGRVKILTLRRMDPKTGCKRDYSQAYN